MKLINLYETSSEYVTISDI